MAWTVGASELQALKELFGSEKTSLSVEGVILKGPNDSYQLILCPQGKPLGLGWLEVKFSSSAP